MHLALFDLDHTLLDGDSDVLWSEYLARFGAMDAARAHAFHREYVAGTLDIYAFLAFQLGPLVREPHERVLAWREAWIEELVRPRLPRAAHELVAAHVERGHTIALISATHSFLSARVARELAIDEVIATEPEVVDGRYTGAIVGAPCFREGKLTCLDAWLAKRGLRWSDVTESWFYSDSHNDLPLLERVRHPVVVNADSRLRAHAERNGWPSIELRAQRSAST